MDLMLRRLMSGYPHTAYRRALCFQQKDLM